MASCGSIVQEVLDFNLVVHSPYQELTANLRNAQAAELAECAWWLPSPLPTNTSCI